MMLKKTVNNIYLQYYSLIRIVLPMVIFAACLGLGGFACITAPGGYESSARLWLQRNPSEETILSQRVPFPLSSAFTSPLATFCELLNSESVLNAVYSRVSDEFPANVCPTRRQIAQGLKAAPVKGADVILITYRSQNPKVTMSVVQAVVDSLLQYNQGQVVRAASQSRKFLAVQVKQAEKADIKARLDLKKFADENGTANFPDYIRGLLNQQTSNNADIENTRSKISDEQANLDQYRSKLRLTPDQVEAARKLATDQSIKTMGDSIAEKEVKYLDLAARLKESHPRVRRCKTALNKMRTAQQDRARDLAGPAGVYIIKNNMLGLQDSQQRVIDDVDDSESKLSSLQSKLSRQVATAETVAAKLKAAPELQKKFAELTRQMEIATETLKESTIGLRQSQLMEFRASTSSNIKLIDGPTDPKHGVDSTLYFLVGGLCGLTLAALAYIQLGMSSPRVKSIQEVVTYLPFPIASWTESRPEQTFEQQLMPAMQTLYFNWVHALPGKHKRIVVMSMNPGEGKTQVAVGLADCLALKGLDVALVDTNFSSPAVHNALNLAPTPGLTDYLQLGDGLQAMWQKSKSGARVLTAGTTTRSTFDMHSVISSERLDHLQEQVDILILDTPALSQSPSSLGLLSAGSHFLFVVDIGSSLKQSLGLAAVQLPKQQSNAGAVFVFGADNNDLVKCFVENGRSSREVEVEANVAI